MNYDVCRLWCLLLWLLPQNRSKSLKRFFLLIKGLEHLYLLTNFIWCSKNFDNLTRNTHNWYLFEIHNLIGLQYVPWSRYYSITLFEHSLYNTVSTGHFLRKNLWYTVELVICENYNRYYWLKLSWDKPHKLLVIRKVPRW